ncbi:FAD binding domain-containing protein [Colletotrichum higginsianum IMI 349063]|uniref:FAD binding domain-containing protein n=2 Tax=Colletotrichum higginsianum TaxID=80884 RepID=A0A1B7YN68_COLHI|nr:FAD binding domain-containing protein [Colletotrichum higginsianum IMI 349063]OBR13491.1 FAD binding domain-containing protein [Colletotrichum higginsianum IMI 349063]TID02848.1 putative FAD-linked oxidoreductase YgaK [Colletotrichum higginsianum]
MDSTPSFRRLAVASLLCLSPALVSAQAAENKAAELQACLTTAGVHSVINTDATWTDETTGFQKRIKVDPAAISFPENKDQVALSLDCARNASTSASPLGARHSFQAYGFGNPGSLVISMAAFNSVSFDAATNRLTYGGGSHVGPVLKYLWDNHGRHFPHVRGAHVGLAGSSIGGGYGSSSRHLGTPMDNLESVEYMLYNGTIVNAARGSDLFWAAQGAGASYGVLLSVTTNTHKPLFDTAINFTIAAGNLDADAVARSVVAIQDFALSKDSPDELALRWSLSGPPYTGTGYFYGNPAEFDAVIAPLVSSLNEIAGKVNVSKTELPFWDLEVAVAGQGMNQPEGGTLGGRSFYTQALTTTTDYPLTVEQAKILFESTTLAFNRTDLRKSGFLDLWGGVSRDIADEDTSYAHGKNLWLIRWEANSVDVNNYPADGPAYMKSLIKPFEDALVAGGSPLRGFVNYADTELSEAEWSSRLYGANFERLKQLKTVYDPEGVFVNHKQAIPLP